jgi:hypothetical protein
LMEFPWWICFGTRVTFFVAILFRTGHDHPPPPPNATLDESRN